MPGHRGLAWHILLCIASQRLAVETPAPTPKKVAIVKDSLAFATVAAVICRRNEVVMRYRLRFLSLVGAAVLVPPEASASQEIEPASGLSRVHLEMRVAKVAAFLNKNLHARTGSEPGKGSYAQFPNFPNFFNQFPNFPNFANALNLPRGGMPPGAPFPFPNFPNFQNFIR